MRAILGILAVTVASAPAAAATLQVNASGKLTGATGLMINGSSYDVSFQEGTCAGLFGGCSSASNLNFSSAADAQAAAQALIDQIFTGANPTFDADPNLTFGCGPGVRQCSALIPYNVDAGGLVSAFAAINNDAGFEAVFGDGVGPISFYNSVDSADNAGGVFASFSLSAPGGVPEPATWALMLGGFGLAGTALRRRKTTVAFA